MSEQSTAPKYEQAYRAILDRLKGGRYPVGARMPTEGELAEHFRVSRVTIRRALDMLVQDGYVESRQGSGYRVITLSPASDTCLTSFTDAMLRAGDDPTSTLVSLEIFCRSAPELDHLSDAIRGDQVTRVVRLRKVNGEPRMLVMTYVPTHLIPGAAPEDFPETGPGQSILRILGDRFELEWFTACEDISPVLADAEIAKCLQMPVGAPLLRQSCSAFRNDGTTVFQEDVFRTGTISFSLTRRARTSNHN